MAVLGRHDVVSKPLQDSFAHLPEDGFVWQFNYRGDLLFLDQAREQKEQNNLTIEDGWVYFIHGWTRVIAEVFNVHIPTEGPRFEDLSEIAARARK